MIGPSGTFQSPKNIDSKTKVCATCKHWDSIASYCHKNPPKSYGALIGNTPPDILEIHPLVDWCHKYARSNDE